MEMKTLTVTKETWKMLTRDKLNMDCESIDEVINKYKEIIMRIENEKTI